MKNFVNLKALLLAVICGISLQASAMDNRAIVQSDECPEYKHIMQCSPTYDSNVFSGLASAGSLSCCPLPFEILVNLFYKFSCEVNDGSYVESAEIMSLLCKPLNYLGDHLSIITGPRFMQCEVDQAKILIQKNPQFPVILPFYTFTVLLQNLIENPVCINLSGHNGLSHHLELKCGEQEVSNLIQFMCNFPYQDDFKKAVLKFAYDKRHDTMDCGLVLSYFVYNKFGRILRNISFHETTVTNNFTEKNCLSFNMDEIIENLTIMNLHKDKEIMTILYQKYTLSQIEKNLLKETLRRKLIEARKSFGYNSVEFQDIFKANNSLCNLLDLNK